MKVVGDKATSKTVRNYLEEWHDMGVITLDKHKRPMQIKPGDYMEDTYEMYKELLRMEIKNAKQKYTNLNEVLE